MSRRFSAFCIFFPEIFSRHKTQPGNGLGLMELPASSRQNVFICLKSMYSCPGSCSARQLVLIIGLRPALLDGTPGPEIELTSSIPLRDLALNRHSIRPWNRRTRIEIITTKMVMITILTILVIITILIILVGTPRTETPLDRDPIVSIMGIKELPMSASSEEP